MIVTSKRPSRVARTAGLPLLAALSGCAAVAPPTPPTPSTPPPWTGTDRVDAVDRGVFVGDWRMVALNPKGGEDVPERTVSYADDGSFVATIRPTEAQARSVGPEPIRLDGRWRIENGRILQETDAVSMPGADPRLNELMAAMIARADPLAASAEIYEAEPRRVVIVSDEGYANALERL